MAGRRAHARSPPTATAANLATCRLENVQCFWRHRYAAPATTALKSTPKTSDVSVYADHKPPLAGMNNTVATAVATAASAAKLESNKTAATMMPTRKITAGRFA